MRKMSLQTKLKLCYFEVIASILFMVIFVTPLIYVFHRNPIIIGFTLTLFVIGFLCGVLLIDGLKDIGKLEKMIKESLKNGSVLE